MSTVLTDSYEFQFGSLSLQGALVKWNDTFEIRFAKFEYLKRDGAEQELMGAAAAQFSFDCVYLGQDARQKYRTLINTTRARPRDKLTHPSLGQLDAVCRAVRAHEDPANGIDQIEFTIEFEENQLDVAFSTSGPTNNTSPGQAAGAVQTSQQNLTTSLNQSFATPAAFSQSIAIAKAAAANVNNAADKFVPTAIAISQSTTLDPQLGSLLGQVRTQVTAFEIAARATGRTDAELFPSLLSARLVLSNSIDLYNAVLAQKPPIVPFVVPAPMSLAEIALRLYGADASNNFSQLQQLNSGLRTPYLIPTGTVLQVNAPTLQQ